MTGAQFIAGIIRDIGQTWFDSKSSIETLSVVQDQAIHVFVGVLLQLLFAAILRRPISDLIPWMAVLALELANEWADVQFSTWPGTDARYYDSIVDLGVTMALPTILLIIARGYPRLLTRP